ncbi:MAG: c-type cytochrome [Candidatus Rokubacteria bacterium]|nr:c-type cytochrome [Candidatus Rokubacteria bacterium]
MRASAALAAVLLVASAGAAGADAPFAPPAAVAIPFGPLGEAIRYGEKVATQTSSYAKANVGAGLDCTSSHIKGARAPNASNWVGLWGVYPEYDPRSGRVITLADRINECFRRSMNGKPLLLDSAEMRGLLSFIWWLSKDVPTGVSVEGRGFKPVEASRPADPAKGGILYVAKCAACHGVSGQGVMGGGGYTVFPALWGSRSFNVGAGMARLDTAAAFVKVKMPLGGAALTDQEAYDVAAYFTRRPRPDFKAKKGDWPNGDKPKDARY